MFDEALTQMIKSAHQKTPLSQAAAEKLWAGMGTSGYFRWKEIIAPDAALNHYLK